MIDGHGDDLFRYGDKIRINFSTNVPQHVDHAGLLRHLAGAGAMFRNYPEPEPRSVEIKLALHHGVESSNIIVTNGATEAIYLLAHAFMGGRSSVIAPTFREYQDACRVFNHSVRFIASLDGMGNDDNVAWVCNPNNPTGQAYNREALLSAIDAHPSTAFVVDQSYAAFSVKDVLTVEDVLSRRNAVMLHSMTKQYVVPGLRIGYAIGPECLIDRLRTLRMPWSVNAVAIEAARYLIDHESEYVFDAHSLHAEAKRLSEEMRQLGITVIDTHCNFILAQLPYGTAAELKSWLVENHGMLIRDASNFEGLSTRHFRVAAQSKEENTELIKALTEWTTFL